MPETDTFCDWCWTDPGPGGACDCPPVLDAAEAEFIRTGSHGAEPAEPEGDSEPEIYADDWAADRAEAREFPQEPPC